MKDYSALVKRLNKVIDKAANRVAHSKVHIVAFDVATESLTGLVIILAEPPQEPTENLPPQEISA